MKYTGLVQKTPRERSPKTELKATLFIQLLIFYLMLKTNMEYHCMLLMIEIRNWIVCWDNWSFLFIQLLIFHLMLKTNMEYHCMILMIEIRNWIVCWDNWSLVWPLSNERKTWNVSFPSKRCLDMLCWTRRSCGHHRDRVEVEVEDLKV